MRGCSFRLVCLMASMLLCISANVFGQQKPTEIEYWQYYVPPKEAAVAELIKQFEKENPNIRVKQVTVPYEQYVEKVAAAVPAGQGPDVVCLYYGWIPLWSSMGFVVPLPEKDFPLTLIKDEFASLVAPAVEFNGRYWALPTGIRTLGLFYNKDLFREAGLEGPPKTWDELVNYAIKLTKRDSSGKLQQSGFYIQIQTEDHHLFREALLRQNGAAPHSPDRRTVTFNKGPEAYEAWQFLLDFQLKHKTTEPGFFGGQREAFYAGRCAMFCGSSFTLGLIKENTPKSVNWGTAVLPAGPKGRASFASFWAHAITAKAQKDPMRMAAAVKFLKFLTSEDAMRLWAPLTGELPARKSILQESAKDPLLAPFVDQIPYSHATFFVDELAEKDILVQAWDKVTLKGEDPKRALDDAAKQAQKLYDAFWEKYKK